MEDSLRYVKDSFVCENAQCRTSNACISQYSVDFNLLFLVKMGQYLAVLGVVQDINVWGSAHMRKLQMQLM